MLLEYMNNKWFRHFEGYPAREISEDEADEMLKQYDYDIEWDEDDYKLFKIYTNEHTS